MLVKIAVEALADEAAVAGVDGKLLGERRGQRLLDLGWRGGETLDNAHQLARQAERLAGAQETRGKIVGGEDGRAHRAEIAGTAAAQCEPGERAGKIRRGLQRLAQLCAQARLAHEIGDGVEPRIHRIDVGQGACEPACQLARAGGGDGAVDGGQEASGARALIGAGKLQIGAGRGIDDEEAAGGLFARRPQQRRLADLGDLHIGEEAGQARQARRG